jgi:hypothetical protein
MLADKPAVLVLVRMGNEAEREVRLLHCDIEVGKVGKMSGEVINFLAEFTNRAIISKKKKRNSYL